MLVERVLLLTRNDKLDLPSAPRDFLDFGCPRRLRPAPVSSRRAEIGLSSSDSDSGGCGFDILEDFFPPYGKMWLLMQKKERERGTQERYI